MKIIPVVCDEQTTAPRSRDARASEFWCELPEIPGPSGLLRGFWLLPLSPLKRKKEAERRKTQVRTTAPSEGAARARPGALAFRRSTAALADGSRRPEGAATGQASWATAPRSAGFPAGGLPTSSDAPRTPVIVPAG